jgi:hypothetical protein
MSLGATLIESPPNRNFETALASFMAQLSEMMNTHRKANFPNITGDIKIGRDPGGVKFIRITKEDTQKSVYCFVEVATGNIMKAASFKAPAKHARGNIFNANPLDGCGPYGVQYLK